MLELLHRERRGGNAGAGGLICRRRPAPPQADELNTNFCLYFVSLDVCGYIVNRFDTAATSSEEECKGGGEQEGGQGDGDARCAGRGTEAGDTGRACRGCLNDGSDTARGTGTRQV